MADTNTTSEILTRLQNLLSRKFIVSVASNIACVLALFMTDEQAGTWESYIIKGGALLVLAINSILYIVTQGKIDLASVTSQVKEALELISSIKEDLVDDSTPEVDSTTGTTASEGSDTAEQ